MSARILLLLAAVPFLELYLLLLIGFRVGFWPTVAFVVVSAAFGATVARREGERVLRSFQQTRAQGRVPEEGLLSALLVFAGGLLLIFPGVITDVAGIVLVIPPTRRFIAERIRRRISRSRSTLRTTHFGTVSYASYAPEPAQTQPPEHAWRRVPSRRDRPDFTDAELVEE